MKRNLARNFSLLLELISLSTIGFSSWLIYGNIVEINNVNVNVSNIITNVNTENFKYLSSNITPFIKEGFINDETIVNKGSIGLRMRLNLIYYRELIDSLKNNGELSFYLSFTDLSVNENDIFKFLDTTNPIECYYNCNNTTAIYDIKCNNSFTNTSITKGYRSEFIISSLNNSLTETYLYFEVRFNFIVSETDFVNFETIMYNALTTSSYKLETYVLNGIGV